MMAATEATVVTPTLSLVLGSGVLVAAAYVSTTVPAWLAVIPLGIVVVEGVIMLGYATRVARTASRAVEEQRLRLAAGDDVRKALADAARKGDQA